MGEYIVNSFDEYLKVIEQYRGNHLFRGQADKDWPIRPSIFRQQDLLLTEMGELREKLGKTEYRPLVKLFEMQHMGEKTRLLDLTVSPLAALYFVIEDESCAEKDGAVYIVNKSKSNDLDSKEVLVIEEFLKGNTIQAIADSLGLSNSAVECILTSEHLIKYDYKFSYTNDRAILQGGTAIFWGGTITDKGFINYSDRNIDLIIDKKIVIPSRIKASIRHELDKLGYCKEILYNNYTEIKMDSIEILEKHSNVHKTSPFYKAVIQYKLSSYKVNADWLVDQITYIYNEIYNRYGRDSRVWLQFYYDDYDKSEGNWICRSDWREDGYQIKWKRDYHVTRMRRMNEEVSKGDMLKQLIPLIEDTRLVHLEIENLVLNEESVDKIRIEIGANEKRCTANFLRSSNIPKSNIDIEIFAEYCMQYISLVDSIIRDSKLYSTDLSFNYYLNKMLRECNNKWLKISPLLFSI